MCFRIISVLLTLMKRPIGTHTMYIHSTLIQEKLSLHTYIRFFNMKLSFLTYIRICNAIFKKFAKLKRSFDLAKYFLFTLLTRILLVLNLSVMWRCLILTFQNKFMC